MPSCLLSQQGHRSRRGALCRAHPCIPRSCQDSLKYGSCPTVSASEKHNGHQRKLLAKVLSGRSSARRSGRNVMERSNSTASPVASLSAPTNDSAVLLGRRNWMTDTFRNAPSDCLIALECLVASRAISCPEVSPWALPSRCKYEGSASISVPPRPIGLRGNRSADLMLGRSACSA